MEAFVDEFFDTYSLALAKRNIWVSRRLNDGMSELIVTTLKDGSWIEMKGEPARKFLAELRVELADISRWLCSISTRRIVVGNSCLDLFGTYFTDENKSAGAVFRNDTRTKVLLTLTPTNPDLAQRIDPSFVASSFLPFEVVDEYLGLSSKVAYE